MFLNTRRTADRGFGLGGLSLDNQSDSSSDDSDYENDGWAQGWGPSAHPKLFLSGLFAGGRGVSGGPAGFSPYAQNPRPGAQTTRPTTAQAMFRAGASARTAFPLGPPPPPPGAALTRREAAVSNPGGARTTRPLSAPSARRIMQLQECERIKSAFDRHNLRLDSATLERALLTPEDMPDDYCRSVLPTFRSTEVDPAGPKKGKKGKKKVKGKGKKSVKKKA